MNVRVIDVFQDKFTKRLYQPGEEIEIEDESRVEDLTGRKLVEVIEKKEPAKGIALFEQEFEKKVVVEALKSVGERATMSMKEETLIANVTALDEEKILALKQALGIEA